MTLHHFSVASLFYSPTQIAQTLEETWASYEQIFLSLSETLLSCMTVEIIDKSCFYNRHLKNKIK